jgi:3-phenylpropionate/trans-cinnamate dioxygenase ferredoxin subunit
MSEVRGDVRPDGSPPPEGSPTTNGGPAAAEPGTVAVGPLGDLSEATPVVIEAEGRRIVVVRIDEEVFALEDRCSHEDYPLSEGEVDAEFCEIECFKHGSTFSLRTGVPQCLPATRPVRVYPVAVREGTVVVVTGDVTGATGSPAGPAAGR